jgi:hypothetical protein
MPSTYEPIATTTLGSAAASITFSSIASSWTDLRISFTGTATGGTSPIIRFNSDTGTNYSQTILYGDGSAAYSYNYTSQGKIFLNPDSSFNATPQFNTIDIFSYAGSTYKTALVTSQHDKNGSGVVERIVGLWRSTSAITSVTLSLNGGQNMDIGTIATLYGIKNA